MYYCHRVSTQLQLNTSHHIVPYHITNIIDRHELGLSRPVSASSNNLFKALPNRLRPFGLQFSIISIILLLFIPVTCRNQFDLYSLSFSSIGSAFTPSEISSFLLWSKRVYPAVLKNLISIDVNRFLSFDYGSTFRFQMKEWEETVY